MRSDGEFEYVEVRSDDAAKWDGRDGWERAPVVVLRRRLHLTGDER